jgi:hypothetical protein
MSRLQAGPATLLFRSGLALLALAILGDLISLLLNWPDHGANQSSLDLTSVLFTTGTAIEPPLLYQALLAFGLYLAFRRNPLRYVGLLLATTYALIFAIDGVFSPSDFRSSFLVGLLLSATVLACGALLAGVFSALRPASPRL